jgi:hypothetical protein
MSMDLLSLMCLNNGATGGLPVVEAHPRLRNKLHLRSVPDVRDQRVGDYIATFIFHL